MLASLQAQNLQLVPCPQRRRLCCAAVSRSQAPPAHQESANPQHNTLELTHGSKYDQAAAPAQHQSLGLGGAPPAAPPPATPRLQLHYHTTWHQPILHHSINGGTWQGVEMQQVVSGHGWWKAADLHLDPAAGSHASATTPASPLLEFVITDGKDAWDKLPSGDNFTIQEPGRWQLSQGLLEQVQRPPLLLVSDLDDTMIGDDVATGAFTQWWQEEGVPAGGRLVYNTGRALDLFESLLEDKGKLLATPDMLITAIGTRIYAKGSNGEWQEDERYTASLGQGWQLEGVREACYRALAQVGKEAMHFRPPSEMSEHKVTCGVRLDVLEAVLASISADLAAADVAHKLIVSGSGGWRFVDLVPREAGKLQALEYARRSLGFLPDQTVAAGDSGNDIDMMEGQHRCIVVGNAHPELLAWAQTRQVAGNGELLITKAHRAHGILEGLMRWGFKT